MASPHVSGVAALVWSHYPNCTNVEIRNALTASALDVGEEGRDYHFGHGIVKAGKALNYLNLVGCNGGNYGLIVTTPKANSLAQNVNVKSKYVKK